MLESWQVGPANRWTYVHVDEVVPTVVVPRGDRVRELPRGASELRLDDDCNDGLAAVRDGVLVLERYGGEMDEASLHLSQSVGKSVLGLLVATLGVDTAARVTGTRGSKGSSGSKEPQDQRQGATWPIVEHGITSGRSTGCRLSCTSKRCKSSHFLFSVVARMGVLARLLG